MDNLPNETENTVISGNGTPAIYRLMPKVMADIGAVPPLGLMKHDGNYPYQKLKDILAHVHAALVKHEVFIIPRVLERTFGERVTKSGVPYKVVYLKVAYRFYATDGSFVESLVESEGEDNGDKATLKALSFAFKACLQQSFAIPAEDLVDGDDERAEESVRGQGEQPNAKRGNLKAVQGSKQQTNKQPAAAADGDAKNKKDDTSQLSEEDVDQLLDKACAAFKITDEQAEIEAVKTHLKLKNGLPRKDWDLGLKRAMLTKLRAERDRIKAASKEKSQGQQASATQ